MCASWSVTPWVASSSSSTTLASAMACSVLTTENFSMASNTLPLRRSPAVSIRSNVWPSCSKGTWMASRVVPGWSKATSRSSPSQVLISVDLPTFGRPATARRIGLSAPSSSSGSASGSGSPSNAASIRLRMPCPCAAEIGCGSPMPEFVELGQARRIAHALGLVHRQQHAPCRAAQVARDVVVLRAQAAARVEHEDHHIGLGHRLARLLGHLAQHAVGGVGLEAAGVDDDELAPVDLGVAVVAVARQAGKVGDDGVAAVRQPVEQRGLADVGPADDGQDRLHCGRKANNPPLRVTTSSVVPDSTGLPTTGEPSVGRRSSGWPSLRSRKCT